MDTLRFHKTRRFSFASLPAGGQPGFARPSASLDGSASRAVLTSLLVATALMVLGAGAALANPQANDNAAAKVTLNVVHATSATGGVAPDLERISKWLLKSFPNYTSFKRISGREDTLAVGQEVKETLPNGKTLTYKHLGWKDGFATIALSVDGLETTVNVKEGKGFLQAGRAYEGGMIVLAFRVGGG